MSAVTIDSIVQTCIGLFQEIHALILQPERPLNRHINIDDVMDELGRLKVWSAEIGAVQSNEMTNSLEYRLREAARTGEQVLNFLQDLEECLQESKAPLENSLI
jgi:hypothetical protein